MIVTIYFYHLNLQSDIPGEADIEETFLRLNNRRRRLESLRKGLRKLENDDLSEASMNFARLSNLGLLSTNRYCTDI